jgi:hypothetical protein
MVDDSASPTTTSPMVSHRSLLGVSQEILRVASQARAPLLATPAVIAPIMH